MAKDGTARGGARVGSGRKKKPLAEKVNNGTADSALVLPTPVDFDGVEMPPPKEYLNAKQKDGKNLCAVDVYKKTFAWLKGCGCDKQVNPQLVEQYSMSVARYIQCEEAISEFGFLSRHPTTGAACTSPFVQMSQNYLKQVNQCWYQIYQIVKENCSVEFKGASPQDDLMERLLSARKGI